MKHDLFIQLLHSWQGFYSLLGEAAATLTGLMFVAASLGASLINDETTEQVRTFITPNVIYYSLVLLLSASMNVPDQTPLTLAVKLMAFGLIGSGYTLSHLGRLREFHRKGNMRLQRWIWNFVLPLTSALILIGAALVVKQNVSAGLDAAAAGTVLLIMVGLHNAWDVTLSVARRTTS